MKHLHSSTIIELPCNYKKTCHNLLCTEQLGVDFRHGPHHVQLHLTVAHTR